jgi:hypothetical protein
MSLNLKCSPTSTKDEKIINISNDKINILQNNISTGFINLLNMNWSVENATILNLSLLKDTQHSLDLTSYVGSDNGVKFLAIIVSNSVIKDKNTENDKLSYDVTIGGTLVNIPLGRLTVFTGTNLNPFISDTGITFYNGDYDRDDDTLSNGAFDVTLQIIIGG